MNTSDSKPERPAPPTISGSSITPPVVKTRSGWSFSFKVLLALALVAVVGFGGWNGYRRAMGRLEESCRKASKERRWADLETHARTWSEWSPKSSLPWVFLADAAQQQNRFVEAAEYLTYVPDGSKEELDSRLVRCKILFGPANRPYEGEQACLDLLAREPRVAEAHALLIQFYAVTLQRQKMRQQISWAIREKREPPDAYIYKFFSDSLQLAQAPELCEKWLDTYPDDEILTVAQTLHRIDVAVNAEPTVKGDDSAVLTENERDAIELLGRYPGNINLLAFLIDDEITKGRVEKVVKLLAEAPVDAEHDPRFWRFKGWVHFVRKELDQAETSYRKALEIHPMDWLSLHRLAELLRLRGRTEEVVKLESIVAQAHELRAELRQLPSASNPPNHVLRKIGLLARDAGDTEVAQALDFRVKLNPKTSPTKGNRLNPTSDTPR